MPLTWSVANVKDYKTITTSPQTRGKETEKWHPVTDSLVWFSMSCGFNAITEKNWEKIAERIAIIQHITGPAQAAQDGDIYVTKEDVKLHIGMTTNATVMSDVKFQGHMMNLARERSKTIESGFANRKWSDSGDKEISAYEVSELLHKRYPED